MHLRPVMAVASLKPTPGTPRGHPRIVPRSGRVRPFATEIVLDPDDVVELRRRHLEQLAALDRLEPMDPPGRDVAVLPGAQLVVADDAVLVLEVQLQPTGGDEDRLILGRMALERQSLAGLDDEPLADVSIRVRPDQLVAPRLVDADGLVAHEPRTRRSPATSIASRPSAVVASV